MKRILTLLVALAIAGTVSVPAQVTVEYGALGNSIRDPDGSGADSGQLVRLGTFPTNFDFSANQTFSSLDAAFTQFDTTTIAGGAGTTEGQFFDSVVLTNSAFFGKLLYVWVLNTPTASNPTAWLILTSTDPNWVTPTAGPDFTAIDTSDPGVFVPFGALGGSLANITSPNGKDWQIIAVPEPSTYALLVLGSAAALVARRRRRR
jgi:hypothetical protein